MAGSAPLADASSGGGESETFDPLDTNQDGTVSTEERAASTSWLAAGSAGRAKMIYAHGVRFKLIGRIFVFQSPQ